MTPLLYMESIDSIGASSLSDFLILLYIIDYEFRLVLSVTCIWSSKP